MKIRFFIYFGKMRYLRSYDLAVLPPLGTWIEAQILDWDDWPSESKSSHNTGDMVDWLTWIRVSKGIGQVDGYRINTSGHYEVSVKSILEIGEADEHLDKKNAA